MLCLTRRPGESIAFILDGKNIGTLTLGSVHSSEWNVRLLFEFDPAVKIVRPDAVNKEPKARAEPQVARRIADEILAKIWTLEVEPLAPIEIPTDRYKRCDELLGQALAAASVGLIDKSKAEEILDAYERVKKKWYT